MVKIRLGHKDYIMLKEAVQTLKQVPVKTLKILGKKYKIKYLKDNEVEDCDGYMDLAGQEIAIRKRPGVEYVQDTLLHESIHAIDETLCLKMTERQVHQLAAGLLAFLKDNKEITRWLIGENDE